MMTTVTEENFDQEVLASSVPAFVHFSAPWCGICKLVTPVLTSIQAEWPGPVNLFCVNADENFKLANRYQLRSLPTLLYIERGEVLQRIEGFQSRQAFQAQLKDIAYRQRLETAFTPQSVQR